MDTLKARGFFDDVIEILLLTAVLAYAVIEILVCFLWKLALRIQQELCSLVLRGFQGSCKHGGQNQQIPLRDGNNSQNCKTKIVTTRLPNAHTSIFTHQNTKLETEIKPRCDAEFCWPLRSEELRCRKKMSTARDGSKTKDEHFNLQGAKTKAGKNERPQRPRLLAAQWVTHKNVYKVGGNEVNKKYALSHWNSNIHRQSNSEGGHEKKVVCHQGEMFLDDSEDQRHFLGEKEGGVDLRQGIFDSKLQRRRVNKGDFETFGRSTEMMESDHLRPTEDGFNSAKGGVTGCKQCYTPLPDWSGLVEEKCHSTGVELEGRATDQPVITTGKMASATQVRKYFQESAPVDGKISDNNGERPQKKCFHSPLTANHNITTGNVETPGQQYFEGQNTDNFKATKHQSLKAITAKSEARGRRTRAKETDASGEATLTTSDFRKRAEKNQTPTAENGNSAAMQDQQTDTSQAATKEGKMHVFSKGFSSHLESAPTVTASTSNGLRRVGHGGASTCSTLSNKAPCTPCGPTSSCSLHQSHKNAVVHREEGRTSGKFNSTPHARIIQQDNQKGKNETNSSNFRLEKVKRSRLPFARTPRRMDFRKNKMPVL